MTLDIDQITRVFQELTRDNDRALDDSVRTVREYIRNLRHARVDFIEQAPPRKILWEDVKSYFSQGTDWVYSRQGLINHLKNRNHRINSSMDTYRNYLHKAGYLRTITRGIYQLKHEIPVDLSVDNVKREAYGDRTNNPIAKDYRMKSHRFIDIQKPMAPVMKKKEFLSEDDFKI